MYILTTREICYLFIFRCITSESIWTGIVNNLLEMIIQFVSFPCSFSHPGNFADKNNTTVLFSHNPIGNYFYCRGNIYLVSLLHWPKKRPVSDLMPVVKMNLFISLFAAMCGKNN